MAAPRAEEGGSGADRPSPIKTVYLIRTHRDPPQILRLVRAIKRGSPEARVLVWHDASASPIDPGPFAELSEVAVFADPEPTQRGGFSMVEGYFRAIDRLLAEEPRFDWLLYLSGQDYPTQPLQETERFLAASGCDGFIRHWDIRSRDGLWGKSRRGVRRYHYRYSTPPAWTHPWLRALSKVNDLQTWVHLYFTYGVQVGVRARRLPFGPGFPCYAGLQWHALSRACVEYLAEFRRTAPAVIDHYRQTILPDESLFQTALVNSGRFRLVDDDRRYYDFTGSRDGHPRTLTVADLPRITGGGYHFARKLDLRRDPELFDRLDEAIQRSLL